jgi:hypothetical protein
MLCGRTNCGNTLLSLRDKNKSPHVTVAYDSNDGCIYQMKGRNNKKPIEKYHPYIYRLLVDPNVKIKYFSSEYDKSQDFSLTDLDKETFLKVYEYNPELICDSFAEDKALFKTIISKDYISKEEIKNILIKTSNINAEMFFDFLDLDLYTQEELIELKNDISLELKDFNELAHLKMYKHDLITIKELSEYFSDIVIAEDGTAYVDGDEDDLDPYMSDLVKTVLFGEDWYEYGDYYKVDDINDVLSDLTKRTKEKIIENIVDCEIKLENSDGDDFIIESVTADMFVWEESDRNKEDFFLHYENNTYSLSDVINYNKEDDLEDIYDSINRGYNQAQEDANQNEYYKKARRALENIFCDFKYTTIQTTTYDGKIKYKECLRFLFHDLVDVSDLITYLDEDYYTTVEDKYTDEDFGDLWGIIESMKSRNEDRKADFDDRYGLYGDIDDDVLNDCVIDQL